MCMLKMNDKVKKVSFGDTTGLSIKRDDPNQEESHLEIRHNCDNPGVQNKQDIDFVINGEQGRK